MRKRVMIYKDVYVGTPEGYRKYFRRHNRYVSRGYYICRDFTVHVYGTGGRVIFTLNRNQEFCLRLPQDLFLASDYANFINRYTPATVEFGAFSTVRCGRVRVPFRDHQIIRNGKLVLSPEDIVNMSSCGMDRHCKIVTGDDNEVLYQTPAGVSDDQPF